MNRIELAATLYAKMREPLYPDSSFKQVRVVGELWFGVNEYSLGSRIVKRNCV